MTTRTPAAGRRALATAVDYAATAAPLAVVLAAQVAAGRTSQFTWPPNPEYAGTARWAVPAFVTLPAAALLGVADTRGGSPGRRCTGLRLARDAGDTPVGLAAAIVRSLVKVALPWELGHQRVLAFAVHKERAGAALGLGDHPVLLFVGRIQPLKGVDVAVRTLAAVAHPDAVLVVVGGASGADGHREVERVRELAADLGVADRIRWVAPQPHHLLSTYYRAADVALVPSRSESFGLVALEAAACGTPVVAAAVGGLRTIVAHGGTGFLVNGRDPAVFAHYTEALLDDPALRAQLAAAAAVRARRYTWSTTAGRLRRLHADLMARSPVRCA